MSALTKDDISHVIKFNMVTEYLLYKEIPYLTPMNLPDIFKLDMDIKDIRNQVHLFFPNPRQYVRDYGGIHANIKAIFDQASEDIETIAGGGVISNYNNYKYQMLATIAKQKAIKLMDIYSRIFDSDDITDGNNLIDRISSTELYKGNVNTIDRIIYFIIVMYDKLYALEYSENTPPDFNSSIDGGDIYNKDTEFEHIQNDINETVDFLHRIIRDSLTVLPMTLGNRATRLINSKNRYDNYYSYGDFLI